MKKKLTFSIFIPAYNEQENISNLLGSISSQKINNFILDKILVVSDGSSDKTVEIINNQKIKKLKCLVFKKRMGKIKRLNQFLNSFDSDIVIQLDADVVLANDGSINSLLENFNKNQNTDLVCGSNTPVKPENFIERIAYFGVLIWEEAKKMVVKDTKRYYCTGQIRGFSRKYLQSFKYPKDLYSGEDVFSFYFAMERNMNVVYSRNSKVFYRLPSTLSDYIKQMTRFILSSSNMRKYFSKELIDRHEKITTYVKFKAFIKASSGTHLSTILSYLFLQSVPKIKAKYIKQKSIWDISKSSKKLK